MTHWINAPCWAEYTPNFKEKFAALRRTAAVISSAEDLDQWLNEALEVGIDPL